MSEPAKATGWIPVRRDKTQLLPIAPPGQVTSKAPPQSRVSKRELARQSKPPAKRLHKSGPEVHEIIQAAINKGASASASEPSGEGESSSSEDQRAPTIGRPGYKHQTDQAKLAALIAARDCQECQWANKVKGCPQCMGFFYQVMRLTEYTLQALQEKLQHLSLIHI